MSEGFAYLDILFFAMVAAFIAFRLRSVLGRRTGQERRRPSPVTARRSTETHVEPPTVRPEPVSAPVTADEPALADISDPALKAGLTAVRLADPNFDLNGFLEGARTAFAMVVEGFARGDRDSLKPLLAADVYASFAAAIDERERARRTHKTELVSIAAAELAAATMRSTVARLTVRFRSEQINVTREADGAVVDGDPSVMQEVIDLWTFERETRSRDPNWMLAETRTPDV